MDLHLRIAGEAGVVNLQRVSRAHVQRFVAEMRLVKNGGDISETSPKYVAEWNIFRT